MSATIYLQDHSGAFPDWYMNTSAPINLTLTYYYVSEVHTYDFSDYPVAE